MEIIDIVIGVLLGIWFFIVILYGIDKIKYSDKKLIQHAVRSITRNDAANSNQGKETMKEQVKSALNRPVTATDLEYAHSLYRQYIEEEERNHKEKTKIQEEFYRTIDEYRNRRKHLLK